MPDDGTTIFNHLGTRIREAREALGLTQRDLARRLGVSEATIQRYEGGDGRIPPQRLVDLASSLGVVPSHFFEGLPGAPLRGGIANLDAGARRLLEIYRLAPKAVKKQLLGYAETLAKD